MASPLLLQDSKYVILPPPSGFQHFYNENNQLLILLRIPCYDKLLLFCCFHNSVFGFQQFDYIVSQSGSLSLSCLEFTKLRCTYFMSSDLGSFPSFFSFKLLFCSFLLPATGTPRFIHWYIWWSPTSLLGSVHFSVSQFESFPWSLSSLILLCLLKSVVESL